MPAYAILAVAIISEVIGTTALKASEGLTRIGPAVVVLIGFGSAFYCLSLVLNSIPVGTAYAVWAGGGIVLTAIAAWIIFGQRPDLAGFFGIGLIVAGVVVLNLLSKTSAH
jgi:multidrug transporter EmrE-like cation transporter